MKQGGAGMSVNRENYLVRLRPRSETLHASQGETVLATGRDGFIDGGADHGLFVHETRLVSRYRYPIDDEPPAPVALSNVGQHTWLGYYIIAPPGAPPPPRDHGSGQMEAVSEQTLELRLSRYVGDGLHEDVDLTNYSEYPTRFTLALEVDADFADIDETKGNRRQRGSLEREWRDEQPGRMIHEAHGGPLKALNYDPRGRYYGSITTSGFYPVVVEPLVA